MHGNLHLLGSFTNLVRACKKCLNDFNARSRQVREVQFLRVQLNRRMTIGVKKNEWELAHITPANSIGKVSHHEPTPSFFWNPRPIRMKYNLPKKIFSLNKTFSNLRHNFYDFTATTYLKKGNLKAQYLLIRTKLKDASKIYHYSS